MAVIVIKNNMRTKTVLKKLLRTSQKTIIYLFLYSFITNLLIKTLINLGIRE